MSTLLILQSDITAEIVMLLPKMPFEYYGIMYCLVFWEPFTSAQLKRNLTPIA